MNSTGARTLRNKFAGVGVGMMLGLLSSAPVFGAVGGSVTPAYPGSVVAPMDVGDIRTGTITIRNSSSDPDWNQSVRVTNIKYTPSCYQDNGSVCLTPDLDTFFFAALTGASGTACANMSFTKELDPDALGTGQYILKPANNAELILGCSNNDPAANCPLAQRICTINVNFSVLRIPTFDRSPPNPPVTTRGLANALLQGVDTELIGVATGGGTAALVGPNLQITKVAGDATIVAGEDAVFTITVTNAGSGTAFQVSLTDTLPNIAGLTWGVEAPNTLGCSIVAGPPPTLSCPLFDLAVGASAAVTVKAATNLTTCQQMTNVATVSAINNNLDISNPENPTPQPISSDPAQISCATPTVDLLVSKTDGASQVDPGATTTYTITVKNQAGSTVTGAILKDPLATNLTKGTIACTALAGNKCTTAPTQGALEGAGVVLPTLAPGDSYQFTVQATVADDAAGTVTNSASVAPPANTVNTGASCVSVDPIVRSFNDATDTCTSTDTDNVTPKFDLYITKTDGTTSYTPGSTKVYTIEVGNEGPGDANNVTVFDAFPSLITKWTWACTTTTGTTGCAGVTDSVTFFQNVVSLPAGTKIVYTVTATISAVATGSLSNVVKATPPASVVNAGTACANVGSVFAGGDGSCTDTDTDQVSLGVGGGHFDFDNYFFVNGAYKKDTHVHEYDDKYGVTGVNLLAPSQSDFNLSNAIPSDSTQFKILVMNQYLSPAARLAVGPNLSPPPVGGAGEESVQTYGGLASETDAANLLLNLTPYTRANIQRFVLNFPETAFQIFNWWGDGNVVSGVIAQPPGCVNKVTTTGATNDGVSSSPLPTEDLRFGGALTIQVIKADTPAVALELNDMLRGASADPKYGWRVKLAYFTQYVLAEYTVYRHYGVCFGEPTWDSTPPLEADAPGTPDAPDNATANDPKGPVLPGLPVP